MATDLTDLGGCLTAKSHSLCLTCWARHCTALYQRQHFSRAVGLHVENPIRPRDPVPSLQAGLTTYIWKCKQNTLLCLEENTEAVSSVSNLVLSWHLRYRERCSSRQQIYWKSIMHQTLFNHAGCKKINRHYICLCAWAHIPVGELGLEMDNFTTRWQELRYSCI